MRSGPGLRTAFAPASSPATPPARRAGQPTTRASGLTSRGASSAMPTNSPSTPPPSSNATAAALTPPAKMPSEIAASEATVTPRPALCECAAIRVVGRVAPSRTAAIGGTRVARFAGRMLASSVMPVPSSSDTMTVRDCDDRRGVRQVDAERAEQRDHALGEPEAEHEPDHRGHQADHEALEHDRAHDLLARGAERPQRGELARALRDGDRQGVEDHERADEQRDAGEAEQELADHPHALVELRGVRLRLLRRCP